MAVAPEKLRTAQARISHFAEEIGQNKCYIAFSGGKDSRAVLKLVREQFPNMVAIHNGHPGETIGNVKGILCIKPPKAENVPKFLASVELEGQFDGTRQDEDKTVIFDGVEIHRSTMTRAVTHNGVFGLKICYPLFDWSEQEVFDYLNG